MSNWIVAPGRATAVVVMLLALGAGCSDPAGDRLDTLASNHVDVVADGRVVWSGTLESGEVRKYGDGGQAVVVETDAVLPEWGISAMLRFDEGAAGRLSDLREFEVVPTESDGLRRHGLQALSGTLDDCNVGGYIIVRDGGEIGVRVEVAC